MFGLGDKDENNHLRVPSENREETDEWFYRERTKVLEAEVERLNKELKTAILNRDHWFEVATDLRKIALNLSEHL